MSNLGRRVDRLAEDMYEKITRDHRVRLVVEQLAQKNDKDVFDLMMSSPSTSYRMMDLAYVERIRAACQLAREAVEMLRRYKCLLALVDELEDEYLAFAHQLHICNALGRAAASGMLPPADSRDHKPFRQDLESSTEKGEAYLELVRLKVRKRVVRLLRSEWLGFEACCQEHLGVDAEALLVALGDQGFVEWLETVEPELEEIESEEEDKELTEASHTRFAELFRHVETVDAKFKEKQQDHR